MGTSKLERDFALIRLECENGDSDLCDNMQCVCGKEILRDFVAQKIALHFDIYDDYYFISICPQNSNYPIGDLQNFNLKQSMKDLRGGIKKANIKNFKCIGYLDIQATENASHSRGRYTVWNVHYHVIAACSTPISKLRSELYEVFNANQRARVAKVDKVTTRPFSRTYKIKYIHEMMKRSQKGIRKQGRIKQRLTNKQMMELIEFVKHQSAIDWIFLMGFRRSGDRLIETKSST